MYKKKSSTFQVTALRDGSAKRFDIGTLKKIHSEKKVISL